MIRNLLLIPYLCLVYVAQAQYVEPFSTPNKGYLLNFADDFSGVNWVLSDWNQASGLRDATDYFNTTAVGVLECIDLDEDVCWESPLLNTAAANPVSLKMDLKWTTFDEDGMSGGCQGDNIKVLYSVNGGSYTMIPNVAGGNACATVAYPFGTPGAPFTDSVMINHSGIAGGGTLQIRVCVLTNSNAEMVRMDNVSVPETGVIVDGSVGFTDFSSALEMQIFPNPATDFVQVTIPKAASGIARVLSLTGQIMTELPVESEYLQINTTPWPPGMYFVEYRDADRMWQVKPLLVSQIGRM